VNSTQGAGSKFTIKIKLDVAVDPKEAVMRFKKRAQQILDKSKLLSSTSSTLLPRI
jgi:hypothetical protein